jgi:hypothetical protein
VPARFPSRLESSRWQAVYNGPIECELRRYDASGGERPATGQRQRAEPARREPMRSEPMRRERAPERRPLAAPAAAPKRQTREEPKAPDVAARKSRLSFRRPDRNRT